MKVNECMCKEVTYVKPEDNLCTVAKLMSEKHIGCIPVCGNENKIVGLITDRDVLLRSIACDKDCKQTKVSEIMTTDVCCCNSDSDISEVQKMMSQWQVRRIPVVENSKLVGIITMGDLVNNQNVSNQEVSQTVSHICHCGQDAKNNW